MTVSLVPFYSISACPFLHTIQTHPHTPCINALWSNVVVVTKFRLCFDSLFCLLVLFSEVSACFFATLPCLFVTANRAYYPLELFYFVLESFSSSPVTYQHCIGAVNLLEHASLLAQWIESHFSQLCLFVLVVRGRFFITEEEVFASCCTHTFLNIYLLSIPGPSSIQLLGKLRLVNCSMIRRFGVCGSLTHIMNLKLFSKSSDTYVFSEMIMIQTHHICIRVCRV